jgi:hypothetical protein
MAMPAESAVKSTAPKRRRLQFSLRSLLALTTLVAVGVCGFWVVWPAWQERQLVKRLRADVLSAKNRESAVTAYATLFGHVQRKSLQRLSRDEHRGIALRAAYELCVGQTDPWSYGATLSEASDVQAVLRHDAALVPPIWWICGEQSSPWRQGDSRKPAERCGVRGSMLVLHKDDQHVEVPASAVEKLPESVTRCAFSPTCVFIAECDLHKGSFPISCIDRQTAQLLWRATATGGYSDVELVVRNDELVAWGEGGHMEAFDAATGGVRFTLGDEWLP